MQNMELFTDKSFKKWRDQKVHIRCKEGAQKGTKKASKVWEFWVEKKFTQNAQQVLKSAHYMTQCNIK